MSVGKRRPPRFRVGDAVEVLYGPQKVEGDILEDRGPLGEFGRRLYRIRINRGREDEATFEIPEEDLEEAGTSKGDEKAGPRREIDVVYSRRRGTNDWKAETTWGPLYKGVKARGAVAYSTGRWDGQREGEEDRATVSVLLDLRTGVSGTQGGSGPQAVKEMTETARELADRMFKGRHPDASIEHVDPA